MVIAGALTATNKDDAAETKARLEKGKKPKLRPINSGSGILKTPLQEALSQPAAARVLAELRPIQMRAGMSSGQAIAGAPARRQLARRCGVAVKSQSGVGPREPPPPPQY